MANLGNPIERGNKCTNKPRQKRSLSRAVIEGLVVLVRQNSTHSGTMIDSAPEVHCKFLQINCTRMDF